MNGKASKNEWNSIKKMFFLIIGKNIKKMNGKVLKKMKGWKKHRKMNGKH